MAYLQPADYPNYGLPAGTTADWITAATALINSLLPAAGSERHPIHGAAAGDQRIADGAAELSAAGAVWARRLRRL